MYAAQHTHFFDSSLEQQHILPTWIYVDKSLVERRNAIGFVAAWVESGCVAVTITELCECGDLMSQLHSRIKSARMFDEVHLQDMLVQVCGRVLSPHSTPQTASRPAFQFLYIMILPMNGAYLAHAFGMCGTPIPQSSPCIPYLWYAILSTPLHFTWHTAHMVHLIYAAGVTKPSWHGKLNLYVFCRPWGATSVHEALRCMTQVLEPSQAARNLAGLQYRNPARLQYRNLVRLPVQQLCAFTLFECAAPPSHALPGISRL